MAQTKKGASNAPTKKQPTAAEMREWYEKNKSRLENFDKANDALTDLRDVTKSLKVFSPKGLQKQKSVVYQHRQHSQVLSANDAEFCIIKIWR